MFQKNNFPDIHDMFHGGDLSLADVGADSEIANQFQQFDGGGIGATSLAFGYCAVSYWCGDDHGNTVGSMAIGFGSGGVVGSRSDGVGDTFGGQLGSC